MPLKYVRIIIFLIISLFLYSNAICQDKSTKSYRVEDLSYEKLNEMELIANNAREQYWQGDYYRALDIYNNLVEQKHPSTPLYYNEIAFCHIALNDLETARQRLLDVNLFFDQYNTENREKKALSVFGEEAEKIFLGDPYERSTTYLLLSLIYMGKGDYDNALAAVKNGILSDTDATANSTDSDYTLLHLIEGKLYMLRGQPDMAKQSFEAAKKSFRYSHPSVRDLVSNRLEFLEMKGMSDKERKQLKINESIDELTLKIEAIDNEILEKTEEINVEEDIGALLSGAYNTLIIVPVGKGPTKNRKGKNANLVFFEENLTDYQPPEMYLDSEKLPNAPCQNIADINFQATTRAGRKMDAILKGKAVYQKTTVDVGEWIADIGDDVDGMAGLAITLIGVAVQGIGGAMNADADTRTCQLVPASYNVYAFDLMPGEHELSISQRVYFEKKNECIRRIVIDDPEDMVVEFAPPALAMSYSQFLSSNSSSKQRKRRSSDGGLEYSQSIIIPPPLGLQSIERFEPQTDELEPEALAPDYKRIMRKISKKISNLNINSINVEHDELIKKIEEYSAKAPIALQVKLDDLSLIREEKGKKYSAGFEFVVVDTTTGSVKASEKITGEQFVGKKDKTNTTSAFYKCFDNAMATFFSGDIVNILLAPPSQVAL
jgi:tetratricopeptide (TPR) repeat protein